MNVQKSKIKVRWLRELTQTGNIFPQIDNTCAANVHNAAKHKETAACSTDVSRGHIKVMHMPFSILRIINLPIQTVQRKTRITILAFSLFSNDTDNFASPSL